jgi:hypothetical protein
MDYDELHCWEWPDSRLQSWLERQLESPSGLVSRLIPREGDEADAIVNFLGRGWEDSKVPKFSGIAEKLYEKLSQKPASKQKQLAVLMRVITGLLLYRPKTLLKDLESEAYKGIDVQGYGNLHEMAIAAAFSRNEKLADYELELLKRDSSDSRYGALCLSMRIDLLKDKADLPDILFKSVHLAAEQPNRLHLNSFIQRIYEKAGEKSFPGILNDAMPEMSSDDIKALQKTQFFQVISKYLNPAH